MKLEQLRAESLGTSGKAFLSIKAKRSLIYYRLQLGKVARRLANKWHHIDTLCLQTLEERIPLSMQ